MKIISKSQTTNHFNKKWWSDTKIVSKYNTVIEDLLNMINGSKKIIHTKPLQLNRAFLACEYVLKNYKKKSKILEMACGLGFVSHTLTKKGFSVSAFDISKEAINSAKNVAIEYNQDPNNFYVANENCLKKIKSNSMDVIIGIGYFRYIDFNKQKKIYKECKRILKKNGTLILDHQNELFEMFALNNESIQYWSNFIQEYCNIEKIFKKGELQKKLNHHIKSPIRKRESHSISAKTRVFSENPLTYENKIQNHSFRLKEIKYPHTEIIPPFLHKEINKKELEKIQSKNCLKLSKNWRSMFMCFQFLTFLSPISNKS